MTTLQRAKYNYFTLYTWRSGDKLRPADLRSMVIAADRVQKNTGKGWLDAAKTAVSFYQLKQHGIKGVGGKPDKSRIHKRKRRAK